MKFIAPPKFICLGYQRTVNNDQVKGFCEKKIFQIEFPNRIWSPPCHSSSVCFARERHPPPIIFPHWKCVIATKFQFPTKKSREYTIGSMPTFFFVRKFGCSARSMLLKSINLLFEIARCSILVLYKY